MVPVVVGDVFARFQVMLLLFMPLGNGLSVGGMGEVEAQVSGRITSSEGCVLSFPMPAGKFFPPFLLHSP